MEFTELYFKIKFWAPIVVFGLAFSLSGLVFVLGKIREYKHGRSKKNQ